VPTERPGAQLRDAPGRPEPVALPVGVNAVESGQHARPRRRRHGHPRRLRGVAPATCPTAARGGRGGLEAAGYALGTSPGSWSRTPTSTTTAWPAG
jgi:hypothetical protein